MNKQELITQIAEKTDLPRKDAEAVVAAFTDTVVGELTEGRKVQIVGFGTFECRNRAARTGVNPRTKEPIDIAEVTVPHFKAGSAFKAAVR